MAISTELGRFVSGEGEQRAGFFTPKNHVVVHNSPHVLVVALDIDGVRLHAVVGHAPHSGSTDATAEEW